MLKSTYLQPPDVVDQTRPAHLEIPRGRDEAGRLVLAGRQEDGSGGDLITSDMTAEEAQEVVDRDPYVRAGAASYERRSFNGASAPQRSRLELTARTGNDGRHVGR